MKRQAMTSQEVKDSKIYLEWGLSEVEYQAICQQIGRLPNYTETGIYSGMWSEHCSYKSSTPILKGFHTEGKQVVQGPGEGAGTLDIGDGQGIVFKIESHNSPSALEPYEGAATGVGGVVRDIFSIGAQPIALLDSLRFGNLKDNHEKRLVKEAIRGIADYGNTLGVPTLGGEIKFDQSYSKTPLVNAMCVGLVDIDKMHKGVAEGIGNKILYVGSATGRDGIHGASFSSKEVTDKGQGSAVQAGDPYKEQVLIDRYMIMLERYQDGIVGMQDMGAAGLVSSSSEMVEKAGSGIKLYMEDVPMREEGMTAYELLLSESQERMLLCVKPDYVDRINDVFHQAGLHSVVIGEVTDTERYQVFHEGEMVVDLPVKSIASGVPKPTYQSRQPERMAENQENYKPLVESIELTTKQLLATEDLASKKVLFSQFDSKAKNNTLVGPGTNAGIIRIPGSRKAIAMTTDCNSRYVYLDPEVGGKIAVSEAARNIVSTGVKPLGITDGLNYGNINNPEVYYEMSESARGIAEACRLLDTPVVSGNVSLNNGSSSKPIYPTPIIGMIGLLKDYSQLMTNKITSAGQLIYLLGDTEDDFAGSVIQKVQEGRIFGRPRIDMVQEKAHQDFVLKANEMKLIQSAHDISEGGLLINLLEMAFETDFAFNLSIDLDKELLFSESQSRFILIVDPKDQESFEESARNLPIKVIGQTVSDESIKIDLVDNVETLNKTELEQIWSQALENKLD